MHVQILTIFPELFAPFLETSLVGKAREEGLLVVSVHDLRDHTDDKHRSIDDEPYGGGGGMVLQAPPVIRAVRELAGPDARRILLSPQGRRLDEAVVRELAAAPELFLVCGRYEGVDERARQTVIDEELSIGDFVLSGGELAAMVVVEAVSRQIPGVVGLESSVERDSFRRGLLDFPHYTRPREVEGLEVPEILLSGHHARIEAWRHRQALAATLEKRPDLLPTLSLDEDERRTLRRLAEERGLTLPAGLATEAAALDN